MIEYKILDQDDHHNRIRVLGSKVGMIMVVSIEQQMKILDNENNTDHNNFFDYIGIDGVAGDGSGTMIFGILKLLSSPKEEFWGYVKACQASLDKNGGDIDE